jgi:hypothetical protein
MDFCLGEARLSSHICGTRLVVDRNGVAYDELGWCVFGLVYIHGLESDTGWIRLIDMSGY